METTDRIFEVTDETTGGELRAFLLDAWRDRASDRRLTLRADGGQVVYRLSHWTYNRDNDHD